MKTKLSAAIGGIALLAMGMHSAAVNASTVFYPTDGTVNFLNTGMTLSGGQMVAIFDDTDTTFSSSYAWVLNPTYSATVAVFTGTNVDVKPNSFGSVLNSTTLSGNDNFILGYYDGSSWLAETSVQSLGADSYKVTFSGGSFLQIDVAPVPVPAAAWLFGSGLLGLVGVARRKQH